MSAYSEWSPAANYPPPRSGETTVLRGVGRCIGLTLLSFGLWQFAWIYHTTKEVSPHVNQNPPSAGLRTFLHAIPIANLVVWFLCWQDIEQYCKRAGAQNFPLVAYYLLSFIPFVALYTYPTVQMRLNDAHLAATNGAATKAPMQTADWVTLIIGWVFLLGVIL